MDDNAPLKILRPWKGVWRPIWSYREGLGGFSFLISIFFVGMFSIGAPYFISNNIAAHYLETVWDPEIALDRSLPVINWLIIPYVALYLFYPVTLALAPRDDRGRMELALGVQGLFMATMFCVLFFLLLPAEIDLRDQLDTHWEANPPNWLEEALFTFIHVSDNPWNAWPSLHIVHSTLLARLITHWVQRDHHESRLAKPFLVLLWVEWALLCVSILATKQHYLFDLVTGLVVACVFWGMFTKVIDMVEERGPDKLASESGWSN